VDQKIEQKLLKHQYKVQTDIENHKAYLQEWMDADAVSMVQ
jgi:hypothetical protein